MRTKTKPAKQTEKEMESPQQERNLSEEQALRQLWQHYLAHRDQASKNKILEKYAYLVRYIVSRMKIGLVPSLDKEDLESVGAIGLVKAMEKFDLSRNVKFETYAYRWVRGSVLDYLRKIDYLSRTFREKVKELKKAYNELKEKLQRDPTDEEIKGKLGIDQEELNRLYFEMAHSYTMPLESHSAGYDNEEDTSWETLKDESQPEMLQMMEKQEMVRVLRDSIDRLPQKEKLVVSLYYYDDMTFKEIGDIMEVSESRVCQLHTKAMLNIQKEMNR